MHTILVSILILLYLVNEKFLIQATEPLAETQSFQCRDIPNPIASPESGPFLQLNQTNFEIHLSIIPQDCKYRYVVTRIVIRLPDVQGEFNLDEYSIKYRLDNTNRLVQLRELATSTFSTLSMNMRNVVVNVTFVEISPLMLEELWISRPPTSNDVFRVRYIIRGFTTPRVTVLSYLIAQPNLMSDETYTGTCNGEVCYGGRGRLMDTGNPTDGSEPQMTVEWRCDYTTTGCSYPLRIQLTGQANVSDIIIDGLNTSNATVPKVILIQPNIGTDSISSVFRFNHYPIEIPINRTTDEIFLYMIIPASYILSISEVEVFSNGANIALFEIEDIQSLETTTSTPTINTSNPTLTSSQDSKFKDSTLTLGIILGIALTVIIVLTILSIYLSIKYRKLKRLMNQPPYYTESKSLNGIPLQPTNQEHSRYSRRLPNPDEIYTTIGPECSTGNPMDSLNNENHDKMIGTSKVITNPFIETLSENHSDNSCLTETMETTLQTPIESCDSNYQDTDRAPNKEVNLEQEGRKPCLERNGFQNESQVYEMRDNPLYPEVEIAHNKDDFSGYDALKH